MQKKWEKIKEITELVEVNALEQWIAQFTEIIETVLPQILQKADYKERNIIMNEMKDISSACEMRDCILLQDAVLHGLLESTKKYME